MDVHKDFFVASDRETNSIMIFNYQSTDPIKVINYSEMESTCKFKSVKSLNRRIKKIGFDLSYQGSLFAFISSELCCVYDLSNPTLPVNYLTISQYASISPFASSVPRFNGFAFCGNGDIYILTDSELLKWNYYTSNTGNPQFLSILKSDKPFHSLHISDDRSLLEIMTTNSIVLYSVRQEHDVIHGNSKLNGLEMITSISVSKDVEFDSFFDRTAKLYLMSRNILRE